MGMSRVRSADSRDSIVARAQCGDRDAFECLVRQHGTGLRFWVRSGLRNPARHRVEIDDLVQEVLLRAFRSIGRFRGESEKAFASWLHTICKRVVLDHVRSLRSLRDPRRHEVPLGPEAERAWKGDTSPAQRLVRQQRLKRLKQAARGLSADQRKVILLVFARGVPVKVAAEKMGRTAGATSELLSRALKKLRSSYRRANGSLGLPPDESLDD